MIQTDTRSPRFAVDPALVLERRLHGRVIRPADADYDEARAVYNGLIDKRPALIARCVGTADVVEAVRFGRQQGLPIAVRGGGHSVAGHGTCDGGLVIDLSPMKSVRVDSTSRTISVETGCTIGDVDRATYPFGLAVPMGIVSTIGVAGLTLGGGIGYLTRQHGLTIDNLLKVEVVLADGILVTANRNQHSDLFWALRGGGGNFGVVTRFVFSAHPVHTVYGGSAFWAASDGRAVMRAYRDILPMLPEALGCFLSLGKIPRLPRVPHDLWDRDACALTCSYNGTSAEGQRALAPLFEATPAPLWSSLASMPFTVMQQLYDPLLPRGLQWYWKGAFVKSLPDVAIDTHRAQALMAPSGMSTMHLYPIDGAVQRVPASASPWPARDAIWSMVIAGVGRDPANATSLAAWVRAYSSAVRPFGLKSTDVNFMMDGETNARVRAAYGGHYGRLAQIKARYDPKNLFRINQNIEPANVRTA